MALDPKKRQKKLAKKTAKRKEKKVQLEAIGLAHLGMAALPIHECLMPDTLFEIGIGDVIFSRKGTGGDIHFSAFMVDVFCLGVKEAFSSVVPNDKYAEVLENQSKNAQLKPIEPSYAKKLIESAVDYARKLGLGPHKDYNKASKIFAGIKTDDCNEDFEFGKDGKPLFVSGPHDTKPVCEKIISALEQSCGKGNYDVMRME